MTRRINCFALSAPRILALGFFVLAMTVAASASAQSLISRYVAGQDYEVVADAPAPSADTPVQVTEFFLYTCPHCYHFEPELEDWVEKHPNIDFVRVPVLFGPGGMAYARLYYTEVQLGVVDALHDKIFDAIHQNGQPLATRSAQRAFLVAHGVDGQKFDTAYDSDRVDAAVRQVAEQMQHFRVTAVPSIAVGQRYWISGRSAGSNERMLEVADHLIGQGGQRSEADEASDAQ